MLVLERCRRPFSLLVLVVSWCFLTPAPVSAGANEAPEPYLQVLFLGDDGHHEPAERAQQILPELREYGINLFYTDDLGDLNPATLGPYDAVIFYANYMEAEPEQVQALRDYVAGGGGFVPLHCASGMFRNSEAYTELVGGAFESHGVGVVRTEHVAAEHPALRGVPAFESWDETYVHKQHNPDRTVLAVRVEGDHEEPWTWVRTHGEGRVFYTAWGHDARTWSKPGFHRLVAQGVRWAAGGGALEAEPPPAPFEYVEASLPSLEYNSTIANERKPRPMQLPLVVSPIDMAWDAQGCLWITETVDYPNDLKGELAQAGTGSGSSKTLVATAVPIRSRSSPTA